MRNIYKCLLHETGIHMSESKPGEIVVANTSEDKFSITRFENGFVAIKVNNVYAQLISQFISEYQTDLFSKDAISFVSTHFRLNSTANPVEYIYCMTDLKKLGHCFVSVLPVKIELDIIKTMNLSKFTKHPFRAPNENLIYFGTYHNNEVVSLASGYLTDHRAVELTGETLPEYRHKGYAKSTACAITRYLLERGYEVFTANGINNIASIQTVESLGFTKCACRLAFFAL